jgi:hypothetical protein
VRGDDDGQCFRQEVIEGTVADWVNRADCFVVALLAVEAERDALKAAHADCAARLTRQIATTNRVFHERQEELEQRVLERDEARRTLARMGLEPNTVRDAIDLAAKAGIERDEMRRLLTNLVKAIDRHRSGNWWPEWGVGTDHACGQCVPGGEMVKAGFLCSEHAARAFLSGQPVAKQETPPGFTVHPVSISEDGTTIAFRGHFSTVRACRHCGVLVTGGPTACVACVRHEEARP